jgi:single-stranded DNA-binding protein
MNSLILAGKITSEPTVKSTNSGINAVTFRLTVPYRDGIENTFTIVAFRGLAENMTDVLRNGDRVIVKGHLENTGIIADDVGASFRESNPFDDGDGLS